MKLIITTALLLSFSTSFSQWIRAWQLPSSDIFSLYHKGNILYAGGKNRIYFSNDNGQSWDSTNSIPLFSSVNNIIVYKDELIASGYTTGPFKSSDAGRTWQNISEGIIPQIADLTEWKDDLYAATLGSAIFKLNPVSHNRWLSFSKGLSDLSANVTTIAGTSKALIGATLNNALYDYLPANSTDWEERFLLGQIRATEGIYDLITGHDSLFLSGRTGRFYMSTDNGLNWKTFGSILPSLSTQMVNAKQALLIARNIFDGDRFSTVYYYIKKDAFQQPFVNFSLIADHFTYKIDILGNKLWEASTTGLFFMSLSDLPAISAADDLTAIPFPVRFILINAYCQSNKVVVTWKTAQEQNGIRFDIERSVDRIHWEVIGSQQTSGDSPFEKTYSFTDQNPLQDNLYRLVAYDLEGRVQYSSQIPSSCDTTETFSVWPNPVHDRIFIHIVAGNASGATIKIFDGKGALVKTQRTNLLKGSNLLSIDMALLTNGIYHLSLHLNNTQMKKTLLLLKQ